MSPAAAVVDLRRPVDAAGLGEELKARRFERIFAVTPLAAWTLERTGLSFETNAALVDRAAFREGCLGNHERVRRALVAAFGDESDSWMGLMLQLVAFAAYALGEDMRLRSLDGLEPSVYSDVPHASRDSLSLEAHLYNDCALYFRAVPADKHHALARRSESLSRLLNRVKRLTPANLLRKLARLAPRRDGPALVTDYGYDWAALRPHLEPRFSQWTFAELAAELRGLGGPQPDAAALDRFAAALEAGFKDLLPRTLGAFVATARDRAARYGVLRRRFADHLPKVAARADLRAVLGTLCGTDEQFLAHHFMKAAGRPSLFYQHGAYMQRWPMTGPSEVFPATHNLAYGSADAAFMSGLSPSATVTAVGSALLDAFERDEPFKGRFLYVLFLNPGNLALAESELAHPDTDHAYLFARHRKVMELFAARPGLTLVLRPHPSQFTWGLYEPLREFAASRKMTNIVFDQSPLDANRYYAGYEGVLMDYPCTGLLQAMAKGRKIACHTGAPYGSDGADVLRRAIPCADDDVAFLAIAQRWCSHGADDGDPEARREYLARFGKSDRPSLPAVKALLDDLLS
ncbi:MAG: hypothetical protein HY923_09055 [Elusimicrobia bacterium]|nr:hypothetical protein [Elusimicrobiota bacterium]